MIKHSLALCAALMLLSACAGSGPADTAAEQPLTAGPASITLPSPGELSKLASEPPSDYDRYLPGGYSLPLYPRNLFNSTGMFSEYGLFSPAYSVPDNVSLGKIAYAMYKYYNMTDYTGPAQVKTGWIDAPTDWSNLYIGMANFAGDRWDWFSADETGTAQLPGWAPYVDADGDVIVVLLLLGTDVCKLNWLVVGESAILGVNLSSDLDFDPTQNIAPVTVNYSCIASITGAELTGYDWDFDDDGTPEVTGDLTGSQQHTYTEPGIYTCRVTAHAQDGNSASSSITFTAVDPGNTPPVAHLTGDFSIGDAPLPVQLDASGSTDDDTIIKYEWDIDDDGSYEYSTTEPYLDYTFMRAGSTTVTVRVTDNDYATDTYDYFIYLDSGWHTVEIDADASVISRMSMGVHGTGNLSRACLVYLDYSEKNFYFTRAITETGHLWSTPKTPVAAPKPVFYSPSLSFRPTTGRPRIAYVEENEDFTDNLNYVEATFDDGSFWNAPLTIDTRQGFGTHLAMGIGSSGNPVIAAIEDIGANDTVLYYRATNAEGTAWGPAVNVGNAGGGGNLGGINLLAEGSLPLITLVFSGNEEFFGTYSATTVDGSSWDDFDRIADVYSAPTTLLMVDGRPTFVAGVTSQVYHMFYVRADDSAGKTWDTPPYELAPPGEAGAPSMAILDGVPTIAWSDWDARSLKYRTAVDAAGSAWNDPVVIDSINYVGGPVALVNCNGNPVICYTDDTNDRVLAGSWY